MTPQEAIDKVYCCMHIIDESALQARDMAVSALKKTEAKRPIKTTQVVADEVDYFTDDVISTKKVEVYTCPSCKRNVRSIAGGLLYPQRCLACGQVLDWS